MSACSPERFTGVTEEVFKCACQTVKEKYGITITGNSGKASKHGFTVTWDYEPEIQTAAIQCTDSPWYVPCSVINNRIKSVATGCGALG